MAKIDKQTEAPGLPDVLTSERLPLKLSEAQRQTILKYAELPAHLAERLTVQHGETGVQFTLDELDDLLDRMAWCIDRPTSIST